MPDKEQKKAMFTFHFRRSINGGLTFNRRDDADIHGGVTVLLDVERRRFAVARCSRKDHFARKLGRAIAMGRMEKFDVLQARDSEFVGTYTGNLEVEDTKQIFECARTIAELCTKR